MDGDDRRRRKRRRRRAKSVAWPRQTPAAARLSPDLPEPSFLGFLDVLSTRNLLFPLRRGDSLLLLSD
jgi:hypothetical protein